LRLRSIDIQGFKSFADRTKLEFNEGVTAVIGPNGSGKSNIADAMRWVMGEQSTKTLRGGKMEDVIFGGTQARKAQGVASVTLNIDNTDRSLNIDADEVSVTRRLYRSGDSEYRINGAMVRLRDVNELFMDTGLGRDGYSIIGQGRVAEIVSARSRERREIFEEAAGISKFRYRKNEAERRLNLAEDNLLRLRDILSELESRVGPLEKQAEKAKVYLEYANEKRSLEISLWVRNLDALHTKISELEDKLLLASREHREAEEKAQKCEEDAALEREFAASLLAEIDMLRTEIEELTAENAKAHTDEAVLLNDISHANAGIAEEERKMELSGSSREAILEQLENANNALSKMTEKHDGCEKSIASIEAEITLGEEKLDSLNRDGEALRNRRTAAFEAIESARLDAAAYATRLGESEERLGSLGEADAALNENCEAVKREYDDCKGFLDEIDDEITSIDNSEGGYLMKREARQEKLDSINQKRDALNRDIDAKRQRARVLSDMDKNMDGFGPSVKFVMNKAHSGALGGIYGPVSTLIRTDGEYSTAIETALGAGAQNIVCENEDVAKRAINMLKNERAGRATFLPLTSVKGNRIDTSSAENIYGYIGLASDLVEYDKRYEGVVNSLLGRVVIAEDLDTAVVIARKNNHRFRVVTLDGQVVNAGGSMTGGFTSKTAGIIGRRHEIEKLLSEAEKLEKNKALIDAQAAEFEREIASLDAEVDALEARKKTLNEDRIRCVTQLERLEKDMQEAENRREEAKRERERLGARIEEMRRQSASSEELAATLSEELDLLQQKISDSTDLVRACTEENTKLSNALIEAKHELSLLERDIESQAAEIDRLSESREAGEEERRKSEETISSLRLAIDEANAAIIALHEKRREDEAGITARRELITQKNQRHSESEQKCAALRAAEREAGARRDESYRELVRLDEQKESAQREQSTLIAKLYDEYELTRSDAEEQAVWLEDIAAANRRLAELRNKIRGLGSVNVGAIEEFAEVSQRYEELSHQVSDVERAKAELTKLITELTGQMCDIFTQKFAEIDRNFRSTFNELFEGGSASLTLSDPNDVLESGIEITVRPPGKIIKNLAALSGGEQSFVAIAIFFAILKVNPSPFCLMDEIEAALDDVNVAKFAAYLRKMTDKTQFIAITHRRGTMEEADVLYGVTMQEEGISKLLQLQVSEIEKTLRENKKKKED